MADDDSDLVSQIRVEGSDQAATEIEKYSNRGAKAFDALGTAADKSAGKVAKATDDISVGISSSRKELDAFNTAQFGGQIAQQLSSLGGNVKAFAASLKTTSLAVGRFAQRLTLIGAGAAAASIAFARGAGAMAKAADGTSTAIEDQAKAQTAANNVALDAEVRAINFADAQRKLARSAADGTITWEEYGKQLLNLQQENRDSIRVANQVAAAQDAVNKENEKLAKSAAAAKAYQDMVQKFGGPLTASLLTFGRAINTVEKRFTDAFGPAVASLIDKISGALSSNATAISAYFDAAAAKFQAFVTTNAPAIQQAAVVIGQAFAGILDGLITALPQLIALITGTVIPAVQAVAGAFQSVATVVNNVFGTQISGSFLLLTTLLIQFTGGFRLLFALLRTFVPLLGILINLIKIFALSFGPLGIAIAAVGAALVYLATQVDWTAFSATVIAAFQAIQDFLAKWINFVVAIPGQIADYFRKLGSDIVQFFTDSFNSVKKLFTDLYDAAVKYLQPIIDLLKNIIALANSTNNSTGGTGGAQKFATGGRVMGRGTSTSDSIPAWLSNNEFVVRAKAVKKFGVGLLQAINSGRFDPSQIAGYATGGLVSAMASTGGGSMGRISTPRSAASGGGARNQLNLTLPNGDTIRGLMAPDEVVQQLGRAVVQAKVRASGAVPSWKRG